MQRYYSNLYWHFTGSPTGIDWHRVSKPADIIAQGEPKPAATAFDIAVKILDSGTLRGSCTERITDGLKTDRFCCVTDIPLKDLPSHAPYYGRVAIGFRAAAIHESFVPVLYVPVRVLPGVLVPGKVDPRLLSQLGDALEDDSPGWAYVYGQQLLMEARLQAAPTRAVDASQVAATFAKNLLKITQFSTDPGGSFYPEREWRHVGDFHFEPSAVAALVVPEELLPAARNYLAAQHDHARSVSLLAWEVIEQA